MKKIFQIIIIVLVLAITGTILTWQKNENKQIEYFGNELEKKDLIRITTPRPNEIIKSPLEITGVARGVWFFEGSFPVILVNWDGLIIAEGFVTAQGNWMTNDFVPFKGTLTFKTLEFPKNLNNGSLILKKDNASGLPEHDDALEIPIFFNQI